MSQLSRANFEALYGTSGTQFPDNTSGSITELIMRTFGKNLSDSFWNSVTDFQKQTTATGTDTYVVTGGISAYASGFTIAVLFTNANTGAATLNVNSLGAKAIKKSGTSALSSGDIATGEIKILQYDGTNFQIIGGSGSGGTSVPDASETVKGIVERATDAEVITGSDTERFVSPASLHAKIVGVQDLFIPASAMWPRTTDGCADLTKSELATSLLNIQSLDFDQTTQEFAQFTIVLPRKYNNGTVTAVVYWTAAAGSGDVQWGISGGAYSNDDALTVALGTAITVDDTLIATNDLHITAATSAITLAGTPADADFLGFQISRNPGSDTLSGDAKLLGVSIRITTDATKDE